MSKGEEEMVKISIIKDRRIRETEDSGRMVVTDSDRFLVNGNAIPHPEQEDKRVSTKVKTTVSDSDGNLLSENIGLHS